LIIVETSLVREKRPGETIEWFNEPVMKDHVWSTPHYLPGLAGWWAGRLAGWQDLGPIDSGDKDHDESMETSRVEFAPVRSMIEDDIASGAAPLQPRSRHSDAAL
jgi:hypothetical protein